MTNNNKRVLIICQHFWPETFRISDIAAGFIENGFRVDVLCGIPNYPKGQFFEGYSLFKKRRQNYKGVNIIRVPEIPRGNNSNLKIFLNYISFPFFAIFYIPWLATRKYDRILIYQLSPVYMALPGIILGKIKGTKILIYILDFWPHSLFSIFNFKNKLIRNLITQISYWHYRRADGIIAVFKGIQTRLINEVGIKVEKTIYIPQAAEKIYELQIKDPEIEQRLGQGFKIVFAGNINPAQSFDTVLKAAKQVREAGYYDIKYIILGEGMSKKWLISEIDKMGLTEYFEFIGLVPVEEVPKYQTEADALILALSRSPLFEYAIPAKLQSYLAAGKPIIGAVDGECQRQINESGCGICCDSGDSANLASNIITIYSMNKSDRDRMGEKGREYHFKHYERNQNLKRLIEFVFNDHRIIDEEYPELNKLGI